jgi:hypothetical protein
MAAKWKQYIKVKRRAKSANSNLNMREKEERLVCTFINEQDTAEREFEYRVSLKLVRDSAA